MPFRNGEIPYDVVSVVLASGWDENGYWEFRCTPMFAVCWAAAKRYAEDHFGRTIHIRTGWNIYRPLFSQIVARNNACAAGNCLGAAFPRTSSHGGEWNGRPCLAADVDPNGLTWSQVDEAMTAAGFSAGLITEAVSGIPGGEPWHYILFTAFNAVPAGMSATPFTEEDDMFGQDDRDTLAQTHEMVRNTPVIKTRVIRSDPAAGGNGNIVELTPTGRRFLSPEHGDADGAALTAGQPLVGEHYWINLPGDRFQSEVNRHDKLVADMDEHIRALTAKPAV